MFEKNLVAILCIVNFLLLCVLVVVHLRLDKEEPVITVNDTITYSKDTSEQEILSVMQAVDQVDGDVSETLVIEKIVPNEESMSAWVTCGAVDTSGNIAKHTLRVPCDESVFAKTDEEGDVFVLAVGEAEYMLMSSEDTQDVLVENTEDTINELAESTEEVMEENVGGETELEITDLEEMINEEIVDGEEGQEVVQRENAEPVAEQQVVPTVEGMPTLILSASEVKTQKGYNPAWVTVIAQLTDNTDSYQELLRNIKIHGTFDNTVVGSYDVMVSTTDSEGNESAASSIRIIVEE